MLKGAFASTRLTRPRPFRHERECGYHWLAVREHTVEELDGQALRERCLPRRLVRGGIIGLGAAP